MRQLRYNEAILTKSSLLYESSNKFATKFKFIFPHHEAIMTYWSLKNTFFTFCKCESAIFKLLIYLNKTYLMSYIKHLNNKFKEWISRIKITFIFHFSQNSRCSSQIKRHGCFSNIEIYCCFYFISP